MIKDHFSRSAGCLREWRHEWTGNIVSQYENGGSSTPFSYADFFRLEPTFVSEFPELHLIDSLFEDFYGLLQI